MKKLLSFLLLTLFIFSFISCDTEGSIVGNSDVNPFLTKINLTPTNKTDNEIQFSMITDVHIGKDINSTSVKPLLPLLAKYKTYLNNEKPEFILNLGDFLDEGYKDKEYFPKAFACFNDIPMAWAMGNHDRSNSLFEKVDFSLYQNLYYNPLQAYTYTVDGKTLSIYKLENSRRTYTKIQLKWLEEALKQDTADYKMFIQHIPLVNYYDNGNVLGFAISDMAERNEIMKLMKKYGVNITFAGHHHKGKFHTKFTDTTAEIVLSSFHKSDRKSVPTLGHFYDCHFNFETGELKLEAYFTEDGTKSDIKYSIYL